jgi:hypothetical protein
VHHFTFTTQSSRKEVEKKVKKGNHSRNIARNTSRTSIILLRKWKKGTSE